MGDGRAARAARPRGATPDQDRAHDQFWSEHYLSYLATRPDSVVAALDAIASSEGAAVVHCAAGKDRTGTVVGLALKVVGVPDDLVIADYAASAERVPAIMDAPALAARRTPRTCEDKTVAQQSPTTDTMRLLLSAPRRATRRRPRLARSPGLDRPPTPTACGASSSRPERRTARTAYRTARRTSAGASTPRVGPRRRYFFDLPLSPSLESAATKASCGTSTRPTIFIRFLPSFCFSSSLRLRLMSPP